MMNGVVIAGIVVAVVVVVGLVLFLALWYTIGPGNQSNNGQHSGQMPLSAMRLSSGSIGPQFSITVVTKTPEHMFYGVGSPLGYAVDGMQGKALTLKAGTTYTFTNVATCDHPLYISTSRAGQGAGVVNEGVSYPGGNNKAVCDGQSLQFTPTAAQVGKELWYQCMSHANMGGQLYIV